MIRNEDYYMDGIWDWSILRGCFGQTKIEPTDIDGCIERHGHKLFIETKQPGTDMPLGQSITLDSMTMDGHTVIVVWGKKNHPERIRVITPFGQEDLEQADLETFRGIVSRWFAWADKQPKEIDPARLAKILYKRGASWRDTFSAEWTKLDANPPQTNPPP